MAGKRLTDSKLLGVVTKGNRIWLLLALALGLIVLALLPNSMTLASRVTLAWDVTALATLIFVFRLVWSNNLARLQDRAARYDPTVLGHFSFIFCGVSASIVTAIWTLKVGSRQEGVEEALHLALAVATIFITWFAVQAIFALHYAHLYYGDKVGDGRPDGGFNFPRDEGDEKPLVYSDFLYFAICAGMTFEASDVQVTQRRMRIWVTCHTVIAFLYNSVILALLVDIAASFI
ncbi:MAG: DUF1345 domain-containing protein [Kiloniellales bacterium]